LSGGSSFEGQRLTLHLAQFSGSAQMRQERLWARQRSKHRVPTTDSRHADPIAPNRTATADGRRERIALTTASFPLGRRGSAVGLSYVLT